MTPVKNKFITKMIKKDIRQRQSNKKTRKKIKDTISLSKNSENYGYSQLFKKQIKKKKKEKNPKIVKQIQMQQKDFIANLSNDTVIKLIKKLQRDIRHSIRQIELLTGQKLSIGSKRWSVERVCSAKLADIRMQKDLWAAYVRGFTKGYLSTRKRLLSNSQQTEQQEEAKLNPTLATNFHPQQFCQNPKCLTMTKQEDHPNASALLPVPSIENHEVSITCNEVAANPCSDPTVLLEPLELIVLEPDIQAYFDVQIINSSSLQFYNNVASELLSENGAYATFGTHMLCGDSGHTATNFEGKVVTHKRILNSTRRYNMHPSKNRPYACYDCGIAYKTKYSLTRHYRSHTGEKPHKCTDCDKAYVNNYNLTVHHKKYHQSETLFVCDVCGKKFQLRRSLTSHYRLHRHQRKYDCNASKNSSTN